MRADERPCTSLPFPFMRKEPHLIGISRYLSIALGSHYIIMFILLSNHIMSVITRLNIKSALLGGQSEQGQSHLFNTRRVYKNNSNPSTLRETEIQMKNRSK